MSGIRQEDVCAIFTSLLSYLNSNETTSNINLWKFRENVYSNIIASPDMEFSDLLKLIILSRVYLCNLKSGEEDRKRIRTLLGKNDDNGRFSLDKKIIYNFCIHYKAQNNNNEDKEYMKSPLAKLVSEDIKSRIADPMKISTKTLKKYLYIEELTIERLAAICFCLELDTFITGELMRKAGFAFSPYSPNKKIRAIYSMSSFSKRLSIKKTEIDKSQTLTSEQKECFVPNNDILLEDFEEIFQTSELDIDLCPTRKQRSDTGTSKKHK
ncbi:MAG: hypothetical protein J6N15_11990 [Ruminiclostridium sp.]|nr:hypothetical protein [Ruminiclostridium sp.]